MKKVFLTMGICLLGLVSQAQLRYGFAVPYDNFNVNDTSAALELVLFTVDNDTLRDSVGVGSDVTAIDGTARHGFEFNFPPVKFIFPIGTTIYNGSNRHKIKYNLTPNPTLWGTRYFYIKLTSLIGVTASGLMYGQEQIVVYIDYDGTNVGIPKLSVHDYRLYPVPATNQLFIEGVNSRNFKIYDLAGRFIKGGETLQNSIDISELSNGLYVLHAISDKGLIVQKFIKE
ncbi:MAG: T9SS type A sorting domain-containing protein [Bacteroidota bacterium]|nr:T9SS type A sorting domain-containing protein [Bacteroidota bacterium]